MDKCRFTVYHSITQLSDIDLHIHFYIGPRVLIANSQL
jgi:hypothetical protein